MSSTEKRPVWVWIIFIWFLVSAVSGVFQLYAMYSGAIELPEGFERPSGALFYLKAFITLALATAAAVLLFLRNSTARWLFLILLFVSLVSGVHTLFTQKFPAESATMIKVTSALTWALYALIVWYTFRLKEKGYYRDSR
ncbi:hypothetical protein [uncultured Microbulbifer sp.]|uniref:hypothetical protein n=1 Tax=uncultured Microbulbifer sp. TaxID=348147 RepID=UPI0025F6F15F|nr:hypothetical protein [uncultured Microbulbifer sp.]